MHITVKTGQPEKLRTNCLIVPLFEKGKLTTVAEVLDKASHGAISKALKSGDIKGKSGETLMLRNPDGLACERLLLVGAGKAAEDLDDATYRKVVKAALGAARGSASKEAIACLDELPVKERDAAWKARQGAEIAAQLSYRFDQTKSKKENDLPPLAKLQWWTADSAASRAAKRGAEEGEAIAAGMKLSKDLANLPGNICTPTYLADQAKALGRHYASLKVSVLDEKQMEKLGMGSLLSVSRGSVQPAKLIVMEYNGATSARKRKPVVLVGKGLTFDAGGISLKPAAAMDEMKYDMCGGASVIGTMKALAELQLPINVVGVVPSSENLPDGNANKPGDIVTSMSGQTIEILNTDAEGRLILCDALTYSKRFDPEVVIDVATLTGACVIALGKHASGLLGNDQDLIDGLLDAGRNAGDRAWQLPLWDEYDEQLKSPFADMANIGGRDAGTITAAAFLGRYTNDFRWAHLDIAGTAWDSGANKGATGRPVPMLVQYLLNRAAGKK